MSWIDRTNRTIIKRFGVPILYTKRTEDCQLSAVPLSGIAEQEFVATGYLVLEFQRSDLTIGPAETGDTVTTSTLYGEPAAASWKIVDVEQRIENWTRIKVQRVRSL